MTELHNIPIQKQMLCVQKFSVYVRSTFLTRKLRLDAEALLSWKIKYEEMVFMDTTKSCRSESLVRYSNVCHLICDASQASHFITIILVNASHVLHI